MAEFNLHSSQAVQAGNGNGLYLNTGASGGTGTVVTVAKGVLAISALITTGTIATPNTQATGVIRLHVVTTPFTITGSNVISQCPNYRTFDCVIPPVSGATSYYSHPAFISEGNNVWCWVTVEKTNVACTLSTIVSERNA